MEKDHIRLKVFGDASILPGDLQLLIRETADISRRYDGFQANVCINYGGRDEIVRAAMRYAEDYKALFTHLLMLGTSAFEGRATRQFGEENFSFCFVFWPDKAKS